MPEKSTKKKTIKLSPDKPEDREKANLARKALRQAVANLPVKPVEKLPMEYLRALPMVIGAGSFMVLFAIISYVPVAEKTFFGAINHFSRKTNELIDYTSLSANVGVSSFIKQVSSVRRKEINVVDSSHLSYAGRSRVKNKQRHEFSTFSESLHLIVNSASSIYSLDNIKPESGDKKNDEDDKVVLIEDKSEEKSEGMISVYDLETKEYSCSRTVDGEATSTPGRCEIK